MMLMVIVMMMMKKIMMKMKMKLMIVETLACQILCRFDQHDRANRSKDEAA